MFFFGFVAVVAGLAVSYFNDAVAGVFFIAGGVALFNSSLSDTYQADVIEKHLGRQDEQLARRLTLGWRVAGVVAVLFGVLLMIA